DVSSHRASTSSFSARTAFRSVFSSISFSGSVAERRRRARLGALIVALVVLTASFFATRGLPTGVGLFDELYRSNPSLVVYIAVYTLYLGFAVADIAVVSAGAVRAGTGALRAGLGIMLVACVFAFAYLVGKIVDLISDLTAEHPVTKLCRGAFSTVRCTLAVGFPAVSVLLIVVGLTVPALPALGRAVRDARTRSALRPLREHLASRYPDVVRLDDSSGTGRERLLTMMSEINDGLLLSGVGPELSPNAAAQVLRSSAATLADEPAEPSGETAFAADVARLRAIAQAFRAEPTAGAANPAP
ncbi:hypothetical protein, partial [Amycolatopsis sp. NPDC000740]|uniref:hypothetical protein n=1 Tax=Amycolatopsis sp. NPDC000740 TaxID=3154269 RepID=UPI0033186B5D